jgi:hypothetical protein
MPSVMTVTSQLIVDGFPVSGGASSAQGGARLRITETIAPSTTNLAVVASIDETNLRGLWLHSDQALTLKTNSSGSPDDTIALAANQPVFWTGAGAKPISANVSTIYVTNAGSAAATLTIEAITDPTP